MKRLIIIVSTVVTALTLTLGGMSSASGNAEGVTPVSTTTHCC
jgi:hypothetical protein